MTLTAETAALMQAVRAAGGKAFHEGTVAEGRAAVDAFFALDNPAPAMASETVHRVSVHGGDIDVLVLTPSDRTDGRILYLHGGGWVCGSASGHRAVAAQLAAATRCIVAVPDYRLAPEHAYPVPLNDCRAALAWFAGQTGGPLFVAGDSAGGNIATVLARQARDEGEPAIAGQILVYPVTDTDTLRPSYVDPENQQILTKADMDWFIAHYVPDCSTRQHPNVAPLRAESLASLPPTFIAIAGHDPLRDEGLAYARRLEEEGTAVTLTEYPGDVHGFMVLGGSLASARHLIGMIGSWVLNRTQQRSRAQSV
jgi:acetyl esterase